MLALFLAYLGVPLSPDDSMFVDCSMDVDVSESVVYIVR